MPMVIPIVAAFAAGAGGVAALGVAATMTGIAGTIATVAAYATIAGAVLTGVGAITGSKDLMKIGAVLAIGGGIAGFAAGAAEGAAVGASSEAADGAGGAALQEGSTPASLTGDAGNVASAAAPAVPPPDGTTPPPISSTPPPLPDTAPAAPVATPTPMPDATGGSAATGSETASLTPNSGSIMDNATRGTINGTGDYGSSTGAGSPGTSTTISPAQQDPAMAAVQKAGQSMGQSDMQSWYDKALKAGGSVGAFIKDNPALVKVGGDMLQSAFGTTTAGVQADTLDWQKSIYNRSRANLNAPIALTYRKP